MIQEFINSGVINPSHIPALQEYALKAKRNIVFVDASYALPNSQDNVYENFSTQRIPEAVFFDIDGISDQSSDLPHMLPNIQIFNAGMSNLGIQNTDIIIIYAQSGIIMGPARLWWMLQGFGHRDCFILNGGLSAWKNEGFPIDTKPAHIPSPSQYKGSKFDRKKITSMPELLQLTESHDHPILDARPALRFEGKAQEPRAGLRGGHIPHSINIPASSLVDEHGYLKPKENLIALFKERHLDLPAQKTIILTCGSGITACVIGLALHHIGETNFSVYDGSWSEWGQEKMKTPISTT